VCKDGSLFSRRAKFGQEKGDNVAQIVSNGTVTTVNDTGNTLEEQAEKEDALKRV